MLRLQVIEVIVLESKKNTTDLSFLSHWSVPLCKVQWTKDGTNFMENHMAVLSALSLCRHLSVFFQPFQNWKKLQQPNTSQKKDQIMENTIVWLIREMKLFDLFSKLSSCKITKILVRTQRVPRNATQTLRRSYLVTQNCMTDLVLSCWKFWLLVIKKEPP